MEQENELKTKKNTREKVLAPAKLDEIACEEEILLKKQGYKVWKMPRRWRFY